MRPLATPTVKLRIEAGPLMDVAPIQAGVG